MCPGAAMPPCARRWSVHASIVAGGGAAASQWGPGSELRKSGQRPGHCGPQLHSARQYTATTWGTLGFRLDIHVTGSSITHSLLIHSVKLKDIAVVAMLCV